MSSQLTNPSNGKHVYEDSLLSVDVGVDLAKDMQKSGKDFKYHRGLENSIKIMASFANAHFIQFVTRQVPDHACLSRFGISDWDKPESHYTIDLDCPKWKVDTTDSAKSCFYEDAGASITTANARSMYDYPGGSYEPIEERAVFCTFVVIENKVTHLVKCSKQRDVKEKEYYSVEVTNWNEHLPYWAIGKLNEFYSSRKILIPAELASQELLEQVSKLSEAELNNQARIFFLRPDEHWITLKNMPQLFQPKKQLMVNNICILEAVIKKLDVRKREAEEIIGKAQEDIERYQQRANAIKDELRELALKIEKIEPKNTDEIQLLKNQRKEKETSLERLNHEIDAMYVSQQENKSLLNEIEFDLMLAQEKYADLTQRLQQVDASVREVSSSLRSLTFQYGASPSALVASGPTSAVAATEEKSGEKVTMQ